MKKYIGEVIEVFIPISETNDAMNARKIGFKVELENDDVIEIIQEQDELNSEIMKGDNVKIVKQTINGKEFIDIELYEGELNE